MIKLDYIVRKNKLSLKEKYIGDKAFYKIVLVLVLPIILQQLFISLSGYIDNIMISGYGSKVDIGGSFVSAAYSGVAAANRLMFIFNFFWLGLAATASIFIAQYYGAKRKKQLRESSMLSIYMALIFGALGTLLLSIFGHRGIDALVMNQEIRQYGYNYIDMLRWGAPLIALEMAFSSMYRSIKKPTITLYISLIGIAVNASLNYCLIYGQFGFPKMGATGAAVGTIISRAVAISLYVLLIIYGKESMLKGMFKEIGVPKKLIVQSVKKGLPIVLNEVLFSFALILYSKFFSYHNDIWFSSYSYSQNISDLFLILIGGLGSGCSILAGEALGQGDFKYAEQVHYRFKFLGIVFGILVGGLMAATSPLSVLLFGLEGEVKTLTMQLLIVQGAFVFLYLYNTINFFTLRAGGDSLRAFLLDQIPTYFIGIPIAIILGVNAKTLGINIVIIFMASHLTDLIKVVIGDKFVKKGNWIVNLTQSDY